MYFVTQAGTQSEKTYPWVKLCTKVGPTGEYFNKLINYIVNFIFNKFIKYLIALIAVRTENLD